MKAVIVYFPGKGHSLKTEIKCYWCRGQFWDSPVVIMDLFPELDFHSSVLQLEEWEQPRDLDRKVRKIFMTWPKEEKVAKDFPGVEDSSFEVVFYKDDGTGNPGEEIKQEYVGTDVAPEITNIRLHKDWANPLGPIPEIKIKDPKEVVCVEFTGEIPTYDDRPLLIKLFSREFWLKMLGIK